MRFSQTNIQTSRKPRPAQQTSALKRALVALLMLITNRIKFRLFQIISEKLRYFIKRDYISFII